MNINTCELHEVSLCNIHVIPNCLLLFFWGLRRRQKQTMITISILLVLCISESCTEIKINLNFYFHTNFIFILLCGTSKGVMKAFMKAFIIHLRHHKEIWKKKNKLIFLSEIGTARIKISSATYCSRTILDRAKQTKQYLWFRIFSHPLFSQPLIGIGSPKNNPSLTY